MIVTNFVLVLGLFVVCYGHTVPLSKVQVTDHGLHGYIPHRRQVTKKSGSTQGHAVHRRSFGSELESDSSSDDGDLTTSESGYYGGYGHQFGGFHSYLPYPPPHHGPYPGAYPPPFGQQHHQMPGHGSNNGWGNNFGPPCHGFGCGHGKHDDFQHGHGNENGHGHGHGNEHGYGNGNGHGHGNEHGHGNNPYPPFHKDNQNSCNEQGPGHEHGHGYGHGHGHGYGHGHQGHGHGHGNGHGNMPGFGGNSDCKYDGPDKNEPMQSTEPTEMTEPFPTHEMPTTEKVMTVPSVPSTEKIPVTMPPTEKIPVTMPSTTTLDPIYDIDVRLGSRK